MHFDFIPSKYPDRQTALDAISREVKATVRAETPRTFSHETVVLSVLELAKNTFDHSSGVGHLVLDMPDSDAPLKVSYLDTGEAFDWVKAIELGHSSKSGNGINFGLGLAMVKGGAEGAGMQFSIERTSQGTHFTLFKDSTHA